MAKTLGTMKAALKTAMTASVIAGTTGRGRILKVGAWTPVVLDGETVAEVQVTVAMPHRGSPFQVNPSHWVDVRRPGETRGYKRAEIANAARWLLNTNV